MANEDRRVRLPAQVTEVQVDADEEHIQYDADLA